MRRRLDLSSRDITLLAVLIALPLLGYQFGLGNQVEQFPIVERLRDPNFIVGDFYTDSAATFGPRYYYSLLLSLLTRIAPLPVVVLLLTCVANLALVLVTFAATRTRLGATAAGAAIADVLTSLIATCETIGINTFDYLGVLQRHAETVNTTTNIDRIE